jgi:hypothetical protein
MGERKPETQHVEYLCPGRHADDVYGCQFCDGGLFACTECGAFEGAMTTHCPGYQVDGVTWDEVYAGKKDFRFGKWIDRPSRYPPSSYPLLKRASTLVTNWPTREGVPVREPVTRRNDSA